MNLSLWILDKYQLKKKFKTVSQTGLHYDRQKWVWCSSPAREQNLIWKDQIANLADLHWRMIQKLAIFRCLAKNFQNTNNTHQQILHLLSLVLFWNLCN